MILVISVLSVRSARRSLAESFSGMMRRRQSTDTVLQDRDMPSSGLGESLLIFGFPFNKVV